MIKTVIFGAIIMAACILVGCGPKDSTSKEMELKEKEKELALKEQELSSREQALREQEKSLEEKPNQLTKTEEKKTLSINPQNTEGSLGQVTFSQNGKTLFYFEKKPQKGKIVINGTDYVLNKLLFNSSNASYTISGSKVKITASNCKYNDDMAGDCSYGKFSNVLITLDGISTTIKNVDLQDCPDFDFYE